jgi:hypothetical protein
MAVLPSFPGPSVRQFASETFAQVPELRHQAGQLKLGALQELRNKRQRLVQMMVRAREREEAKSEREKAKRRQRNVAYGTLATGGIGAGVGGMIGGPAGALSGARAGADVGSGIAQMFSGDPGGGAESMGRGLGEFVPNPIYGNPQAAALGRNYPPGPSPADYSFTFGG